MIKIYQDEGEWRACLPENSWVERYNLEYPDNAIDLFQVPSNTWEAYRAALRVLRHVEGEVKAQAILLPARRR